MLTQIVDRLAFTAAETLTQDSRLQRWGVSHLLNRIEKKIITDPESSLQSALGVLSISCKGTELRKRISFKILDITKKIEKTNPYSALIALETMPLYPIKNKRLVQETNKRLRKLKSKLSYIP